MRQADRQSMNEWNRDLCFFCSITQEITFDLIYHSNLIIKNQKTMHLLFTLGWFLNFSSHQDNSINPTIPGRRSLTEKVSPLSVVSLLSAMTAGQSWVCACSEFTVLNNNKTGEQKML